ncbi:MAG: hypothetical protein ABI443_09935 [Chthoniobacterales bacterium]
MKYCLFFIVLSTLLVSGEISRGSDSLFITASLETLGKLETGQSAMEKIHCLEKIKITLKKGEDPTIGTLLNLLNSELEKNKCGFQIKVYLGDKPGNYSDWIDRTFSVRLSKTYEYEVGKFHSTKQFADTLNGAKLLKVISALVGNVGFFDRCVVLSPGIYFGEDGR